MEKKPQSRCYVHDSRRQLASIYPRAAINGVRGITANILPATPLFQDQAPVPQSRVKRTHFPVPDGNSLERGNTYWCCSCCNLRVSAVFQCRRSHQTLHPHLTHMINLPFFSPCSSFPYQAPHKTASTIETAPPQTWIQLVVSLSQMYKPPSNSHRKG